jgi:hypothetical protein
MADNEFGVLMQMQSDEIRSHCQARATYHQGRASQYLKKADEITGMRRESPNPSFDQDGDESVGYGKFSNQAGTNDPVAELHRQSAFHRAKAERFRFMASHIIPDRVFLFRLMDLTELEIG